MRIKYLLLCLIALLPLFSCESEDVRHPEILKGSWVSVANAKDPTLILIVDDEFITVKNGSYDYEPFTANEQWDYSMSRDSVLTITSYENYDSYKLGVSFRNSYNTMTITYYPFLSPVRTYTFIRR